MIEGQSIVGLDGFKIEPHKQAPRAAIDALRGLPCATIGDAMGRLAGAQGLMPLQGPQSVAAGNALTVRVRQGDNLMIHKALELARPGDVLVVDGGACLERALVGEIMMRLAIARGMAAFVIDGAVRDAAAFAASALPCWTRGVSLRGPTKDGPGEINVSVTIGGAVANPGDVVLADGDGVIFVPPEQALSVARATRAKLAEEQGVLQTIAAGTYHAGWVDRVLEAKRRSR